MPGTMNDPLVQSLARRAESTDDPELALDLRRAVNLMTRQAKRLTFLRQVAYEFDAELAARVGEPDYGARSEVPAA